MLKRLAPTDCHCICLPNTENLRNIFAPFQFAHRRANNFILDDTSIRHPIPIRPSSVSKSVAIFHNFNTRRTNIHFEFFRGKTLHIGRRNNRDINTGCGIISTLSFVEQHTNAVREYSWRCNTIIDWECLVVRRMHASCVCNRIISFCDTNNHDCLLFADAYLIHLPPSPLFRRVTLGRYSALYSTNLFAEFSSE